MASKSSNQGVHDAAQLDAPAAVSAKGASQPCQEAAEAKPEKHQGELANGTSSLDRRHSLGEDPAAMTIEFLRARLLSERSASKAAKQRAHLLARRVSELELKLELESVQRKKVDAVLGEALSLLCQAGLVPDSTVFFSSVIARLELESKNSVQNPSSENFAADGSAKGANETGRFAASEEGSGKRDSGGEGNSKAGQTGAVEQNGDEDSSSEEDAPVFAADAPEFQAQQKPIAWKGKRGDPGSQDSSQAEDKKPSSETAMKTVWSAESLPDSMVDSPRRRNGRSLRRIQRRETRVVEERLKGMWNRLGEQMGTLSEGRTEEYMDRRELLGWMGDVVNILQHKSEDNSVLLDGSGDAKVTVSSEACSLTMGSNVAAVMEANGEKDNLSDDASKNFEKLIAEYEAEEKAQRLWEKQYHAKQHASESSSLNQDFQVGTGEATVAVPDLNVTPSQDEVEQGRSEEELADTSGPAQSSPLPEGGNKTTEEGGEKADTLRKSTPGQIDSVISRTVESTVISVERLSPSIETTPPGSDLEVRMPEQTLEESMDEQEGLVIGLVTSAADVLVGNEADALVREPFEEIPAAEKRVTDQEVGVGPAELQLSQEPSPVVTDNKVTDPTSEEPSISTLTERLPDQQHEHDRFPSMPEDGFHSGAKPAEHDGQSGGGHPVSAQLPAGLKQEQPGFPHTDRQESHDSAIGSLPAHPEDPVDYREQRVGAGHPNQALPSEFEKRDPGRERMPYDPREYAPGSRGGMLHRSRSQNDSDFVGPMADRYLPAEHASDGEHYGYDRLSRAQDSNRSPPVPGVDYDRAQYSDFQRSRPDYRAPYRSPDRAQYYERERFHRPHRSIGGGFSDEHAWRAYEAENRYYEQELRSRYYDTADPLYRQVELESERERQRQGYAGREPLGRELQPYYRSPADLGVFDPYDRGLGRGLERWAPPTYSRAEFASPQRTPQKFHAQPYLGDHLPGREPVSSFQGMYLSQSYDAGLVPRDVRRQREEFLMRAKEADGTTGRWPPPVANSALSNGMRSRAPGPQGELSLGQPEIDIRNSPAEMRNVQVPASVPHYQDVREHDDKESVPARGLTDNRRVHDTASSTGLSSDQSQTYLALPSYAGEGEEGIGSQRGAIGSREEGLQLHTSASVRPNVTTELSQRQQQSEPAAGLKGPSTTRVAKDDDPKPILALPSYAGEGDGGEVTGPYDDPIRTHNGSTDMQGQPQDILRSQRVGEVSYSSVAPRDSQSHPSTGRGVQFSAHGGREPAYHPETPNQPQSYLALPSYAGEGANVLDREAMRARVANYDGIALSQMPHLSAPHVSHPLAAVRQPQQQYHGVTESSYGPQVGRNVSTRHHGIPAGRVVGGAGLSSKPNLHSRESDQPPRVEQSSGNDINQILRALQLAKTKIQASGEKHLPVQPKVPQRKSQATSSGVPRSRSDHSNVGQSHAVKDEPRVRQEPVRADRVRHHSSDGRAPIVRVPRSSPAISAERISSRSSLLSKPLSKRKS